MEGWALMLYTGSMNNLTKALDEVAVYTEGFAFDYTSQLNPDERPGEQEFLKGYDPTKYGVEPEQVVETADNIIFVIEENVLKVLLIERGNHPFKGFWCTPGGFVDKGESLADAAFRELQEETGVEVAELTFVGSYNHPWRDPRLHHMVMNAFMTVLEETPNFAAADDASAAKFVPVKDIYNGTLEVGFDHSQSIADAVNILLRNR